MIITFLGLQTFKIQFGDTVLAVNPASKNSSHTSTRFGSDVTLVSVRHPDFNGVENTARKGETPFVVDGPGEYEINGVTIVGLQTPAQYDGCAINTVYLVTLEGIHLCFLGGLAGSDLDPETLEAIDGIDILFTPIGGGNVLDAAESYKLAVKLEPNVIIPSHYTDAQDPALKQFIKEGGDEVVHAVDKFTTKKKDIEGRSGDIIPLIPS